jgi:hypothetical protein
MGRIYLGNTDEVQLYAKQIPTVDSSSIVLPDIIFTDNINYHMNKLNEPVPSKINPLLNNYNFYFASFYVGINSSTEGIRSFLIKGNLLDETNSGISVDDIGPKDNWISGNQQLDVDFKINFNAASNLFNLQNFPGPADRVLRYKWHRSPKIAKILGGFTTFSIYWKFFATNEQYVDGTHEVFFVFRAPKAAHKIYFQVTNAEAECESKYARNKYFYRGKPYTILIKSEGIETKNKRENKMSIYNTYDTVYSSTFAEWTAKWWQWLCSIPVDINPANDQTGKNSAQNQTDAVVWFLAGTTGGKAERTCTVPVGKSMLFPIIASHCSFAKNKDIKTESDLQSCVRSKQDKVKSIEVAIDGQDLQKSVHRVQSPLFEL